MTNRNMPVLRPVLAFLAFLALALSWSLGTPLLSAADEPEQTIKAAAVVRGEFAGPEHVWNFPGWQATYTTPDYLEVSYRLPHGLVAALAEHNPGCYAFRVDVTAACTARADARTAAAAGDIAATHMDYSPLYYLLVGWPSLLLDGDDAIYGMRAAAAVITAALLAAAYLCAARRRSAAAIGVVAATTPAAIYFGSVVNPSGLEICSALLVWTSFLAMVRAGTDGEGEDRGDAECGDVGGRRDGLLFTLSGALLILTRPLGPVWFAMIVVLVLATRREPIRWLREAVRGRAARLTGAALACALLAAAAWDTTQNTTGMVPKVNPRYTLATGAYLALQQTPNFLAQMLGLIGWNDVHVPAVTTVLWYGAIIAVLILAVALGDRRERLVLLALAALIVVFPVVFEAYSAASYGSGWQGRYALPLAVGLPILGAEIVMRRLRALSPDGALPRALASTFGIGVAVAYLCQVWWTWRRYAQGLAGTTIPMPAKWSPPLGWPAVLALAALGCLGLLALQSTRPRLGPSGDGVSRGSAAAGARQGDEASWRSSELSTSLATDELP